MPADTPIRASTQEFLSIEDIQDDIVLLKDGSCALILQVTAVNFGLLSEGEQDAMIYAYAGLLNSLSFPVQIVIRSKKKDISSYLQLLKDQETKLKKPILVEQMKKYRGFVEATVRENEVLDKKFYVSIPFSLLEIGVSSTLSQTFKTKKGLPYPKSYIFERAKTNLYPKRDHLMGQLRRLGVKSRQLTTQELLQLVYSIYNPESVGQQFVPTKDYTTPLVQAATTQLQTGPSFTGGPIGMPEEVSMPDQPLTQPTNQPSGEPAAPAGSPAPTTEPAVQPSPIPTSTPMPSPSPVGDSPAPQAPPTPTPPLSGSTNPVVSGVRPAPEPTFPQSKPAPPPAPGPVTQAPDIKPDVVQMQSAIDSAAQEVKQQPTPQPATPKPQSTGAVTQNTDPLSNEASQNQ